ncbi:hypothetical protein ACLOJK_001163 [Asimina triloba]
MVGLPIEDRFYREMNGIYLEMEKDQGGFGGTVSPCFIYALPGKLVTFAELEEPPTFSPEDFSEDPKEQDIISAEHGSSPSEQVQQAVQCIARSSEIVKKAVSGFQRRTIRDYAQAYSSGETTPLLFHDPHLDIKVAERFLAAVKESSKPELQMSFFINYYAEDIIQQATESTLRYERGKPMSILDGILIAVKDEIDCLPYPTTGDLIFLAFVIGVARNPYDTGRVTGGSSSGSAAVVAAGLCPVALGVDGGGSVRLPAALCGVVGFKPTFNRIPHSGVLPFNWTVGMVGILAATVEDALIAYAAMSGDIPSDRPASLPTVEVTVPEIEEMRLAHYSTIASECTASLGPLLEKLDISEAGWDARVALKIYDSFSSKEYLNAQRLSVTAYSIKNDVFKYGELDYINGAALVRYQIAGNFLGLPAVTIPVGYDKLGLPIGLQFIGPQWSEATLLHLAFATQCLMAESYRKPKIFFDLLKKD